MSILRQSNEHSTNMSRPLIDSNEGGQAETPVNSAQLHAYLLMQSVGEPVLVTVTVTVLILVAVSKATQTQIDRIY